MRAARQALLVGKADTLEGLEESIEADPLPLLDEAGSLLLLLLALLQVRGEASQLLHLRYELWQQPRHLTHHLEEEMGIRTQGTSELPRTFKTQGS